MPIHNQTQNTVLADQVEIASGVFGGAIGLIGRSSLPEGAALILPRCQSVHMMFMKFAIDVVFVDRARRVVGLVRKIRPFMFSPLFWRAHSAIELPAGTIDRTQTRLNDQLSF